MIDRIERFAQRIRENTWIDTRSLAFFRVLYGLAVLLFLRPSYAWLEGVPPTFFSPPLLSLANLFDRFPPKTFFTTLNVLLILFATLLTIGLRTRIAAFGLLSVMIIGNSFHFSLGKVDHPILLLCVLISLSSSDWGEHFSVDALIDRGKATVPNRTTDLALLATIIAFAFITAGFGKALVWLDFDFSTGGFLAWLLVKYHSASNTALLATWAVNMPYRWLWEFADIFAVVFELGFFWALMRRKRWIVWVIIWCSFHIVNTLVLNLSFVMNAIVVLAFFPWSQLWAPGSKAQGLKYLALVLLGVGMIASTKPLHGLRRSVAQGLGVDPGDVTGAAHTIIWFGVMLLFVWLLRTPFVGTLPLGSKGRTTT
ncbi:MAG: hypothetical protein KDC00_14355 [Flavobacteriales bacterium]|nr:hypothetical protein [Flavobacteriales bacterium]MCB0771579.1 hypothetical protein [Flavobacteriales bacterium]